MEFCHNFIPDEIVEIIFDNINCFQIKFNFIITCKYLYVKYKPIILKHNLEMYLYNDYLKFYYLLEKHNHIISDDIIFSQNLYKKAVSKISTIWENNQMGFFDLRFIFELMFFCNIKNERDISLNNQTFYRCFYKKITNIIMKNNRAKTLENIEKGKFLTCLKKSFHPNSIKNKQNWYYLKE